MGRLSTIKEILEFSKGLTNLHENCYQVKDFRNIFDDVSEQVYFDEVHLSDDGNEIVAKRIFEITEPILVSFVLSD